MLDSALLIKGRAHCHYFVEVYLFSREATNFWNVVQNTLEQRRVMGPAGAPAGKNLIYGILSRMSRKTQHTHFEDKILRTFAGEDKLQVVPACSRVFVPEPNIRFSSLGHPVFGTSSNTGILFKTDKYSVSVLFNPYP